MNKLSHPRTLPLPRRVFLLLFALLAAAIPGARAATQFVTTTADNGAGSLRQAIQFAAPGDTIQFTVTGTITLTSGELVIDRSLSLIGPGANQLALSGNNASRLFWISNSTTPFTVHLSGLTLRQGLHQGGSPGLNGLGGAVFNGPQSALTLSNCAFVANSARGANGTSGTRPGGNGGHGSGGAVFNASNSVSLTLVGCTFQGNQATGGTGGVGASGGNAGGSGGHGGQGTGGAVANEGSLKLINCTFHANSASGANGGNAGLGAIFDGLGGHGGHADGGHLANRALATTIHVTMTGGATSAGAGGASSEVPGNPGLARGGAWFAAGTSNALLNTLVAQNSAASAGANLFGTVTSLGHNLVGATNDSTGWLPGDLVGSAASPLHPQLGPLTDNGGPTLTQVPGAGSPAVESGSSAALAPPYNVSTDQRGVARLLGASPDIGAVEALPCALNALAEFTIDPVQSVISLSGHIEGYPIVPQGAGSLTTTYRGTIRALVSPVAISFPSGSSIRADVNGSWEPLPGGGGGTAPANYGAAAGSVGLFASYGAVRNLAFDLTSVCQPLLNGTFAANGLPFLPASNPAPTLDVQVVQPPLLPFSFPWTSEISNQTNMPATLQTAAGVQTLTIPFHGEIPIGALIPGSPGSLLRLDGVLVAHRTIESPLVINSAGVTNGVFSMRWSSVDGASYRVEGTTNFVHWQTMANPVLGTGNSTSWSTSATRPAQFFRVGRN